MQFEVAAHRMAAELGCPPIDLEPLSYSLARRTVAADVEFLDAQRGGVESSPGPTAPCSRCSPTGGASTPSRGSTPPISTSSPLVAAAD